MDTAGEITGALETQYSKVNGYFHLKKENEELRRRLNEVQNKLAENFQTPDTAKRIITDSIPFADVPATGCVSPCHRTAINPYGIPATSSQL